MQNHSLFAVKIDLKCPHMSPYLQNGILRYGHFGTSSKHDLGGGEFATCQRWKLRKFTGKRKTTLGVVYHQLHHARTIAQQCNHPGSKGGFK